MLIKGTEKIYSVALKENDFCVVVPLHFVVMKMK